MRVAVLVLLLAFTCSSHAKWAVVAEEDPMTGKQIQSAILTSDNRVKLSPYGGSQPAYLNIRVHPRHAIDIFLSLERAHFLCAFHDCNLLGPVNTT
jgi:hypothetical protein